MEISKENIVRTSLKLLIFSIMVLFINCNILFCFPEIVPNVYQDGSDSLHDTGQNKNSIEPSKESTKSKREEKVELEKSDTIDFKEVKPCISIQCPSGQQADPLQQCQCIPRKDWCQACKSNTECGPNGRCVSDALGVSFCAEDCSQSKKCSNTNSYACLPFKQKHLCLHISGACPCLLTNCSKGKKCCMKDGLCHECCDSKDCKSPQVCRSNGTCGSPDLCVDKTCSSGQECNPSTGQCECTSPCMAGSCCNPVIKRCMKSACSNSNQCRPSCDNSLLCCDVVGSPVCLPYCPKQTLSCKKDGCSRGQICCKLGNSSAICIDSIASITKHCLPW